jgi:hypothetical protein
MTAVHNRPYLRVSVSRQDFERAKVAADRVGVGVHKLATAALLAAISNIEANGDDQQ